MKIAFAGGEIRPWTLADVPDLASLADNRNVWRNLRDRFPNPYTKGDAREWVRGVNRQSPIAHLAIAWDGALAGGIGILLQEDVHQGTAEIGYWLGEPFWGQGIMTAALSAFSDFAFEAFKLRRLYAQVLHWNPASMRVLEKAGYVLEGRMRCSAIKDGQVADELLYARIQVL
ncbi:MAG: acetyltransferase [Fibrobacteres bacterium]|nr:acetyltransferase [Fibrobacterota bacterium]